MTPDDGTPGPGKTAATPATDTQRGEATLELFTDGLGCRGVQLSDPAKLRTVPFRLGPLECDAIVVLGPDVSTRHRPDGLTGTSWLIRLVGVPDTFAVADLLEALGAVVDR